MGIIYIPIFIQNVPDITRDKKKSCFPHIFPIKLLNSALREHTFQQLFLMSDEGRLQKRNGPWEVKIVHGIH